MAKRAQAVVALAALLALAQGCALFQSAKEAGPPDTPRKVVVVMAAAITASAETTNDLYVRGVIDVERAAEINGYLQDAKSALDVAAAKLAEGASWEEVQTYLDFTDSILTSVQAILSKYKGGA